MPNTSRSPEELFQRIANHPAFNYTMERIQIAIAPLFEEIEYLEDANAKLRQLLTLHEDDLKRQDDDIDVEFVTGIAVKLARLTSSDEVNKMVYSFGGKQATVKTLKKKKLIKLCREIQYKLSYIKVMQEKKSNATS